MSSKYNLLIFYFATFSILTPINLSLPIIPVYAKENLFASPFLIGLISSAIALPSLIMRFPLSALLSSFSSQRILSLGLLISSISLFLQTLTSNPIEFLIYRILLGVSYSLTTTAGLTYATLKGEEIVLRYTLILSIGLLVSPMLGSLLLKEGGMQATFLGGALMALLGSFSLLITREENQVRDISREIKLRSTRTFLLFCLGFFSVGYFYNAVYTFLPLYASSMGLSKDTILILFQYYVLMIVIIRIFLNYPKFSKVSYEPFLLAPVLSILLIYFLGTTALPYAMVLASLPHSTYYPLAANRLRKIVLSKNKLVANSLFLTSWDIGTFVSPIILSPISISYGYLAPLLIASILPPAIGVVMHRMVEG